MSFPRLLLVLTALAACAAQAGAPPTRSCDKGFSYGEVVVQLRNPTVAQEFVAVATDAARDADLFQRLWQPRSARLSSIDRAVLVYESAQDAAEIAASLMADGVLRGRGLEDARANFRALDFSVRPPMPGITVTEYHNRILDHYFLSSSGAENATIDAGGAGPGWERTGESFVTTLPEYVYGAYRVFRFYAAAAKSHFFTVDAAECGFVRNHDPGWQFEGDAFGAAPPVNGACPAGTQAVYRLYNNRWAQGDSNHRFVTRPDLYGAMMARGWAGEGLAFCAFANPGYMLPN